MSTNFFSTVKILQNVKQINDHVLQRSVSPCFASHFGAHVPTTTITSLTSQRTSCVSTIHYCRALRIKSIVVSIVSLFWRENNWSEKKLSAQFFSLPAIIKKEQDTDKYSKSSTVCHYEWNHICSCFAFSCTQGIFKVGLCEQRIPWCNQSSEWSESAAPRTNCVQHAWSWRWSVVW